MLMVVKPHQNIIYWFDSLSYGPREDVEKIMETAFEVYNANAGSTGNDAIPRWIIVKV